VLRLVLLTALLVAIGIARLAGLSPDEALHLAGQFLIAHLGAPRAF
jgi:hypothetical protein